MNSRLTTLERAFELARSGACARTGDVSAALIKEGYSDVRSQLYGRSLMQQLTKLCRESSRPNEEV